MANLRERGGVCVLVEMKVAMKEITESRRLVN